MSWFQKLLRPIFGSETGIINRNITTPLTTIVAKDADPKNPLGNIAKGAVNIGQDFKGTVSGIKGVYSAGVDPLRSIGSRIGGPVGGIVNKAVGAVLAPTDLGLSVLEKTASGDLGDVKEIGKGLADMALKKGASSVITK
jgi:hypothetical protein